MSRSTRASMSAGDVETEKPFTAVEVIDDATGELQRVACMSCIRGHRAKQCGTVVCRRKIFWTVKRPGRPLNSCMCRNGSDGQCRCTLKPPPCPHKKKGEKRTRSCRCEEACRLCCALGAEHWAAILSSQSPRVIFYPTREALEAPQVSSDVRIDRTGGYLLPAAHSASPSATQYNPRMLASDLSAGRHDELYPQQPTYPLTTSSMYSGQLSSGTQSTVNSPDPLGQYWPPRQEDLLQAFGLSSEASKLTNMPPEQADNSLAGQQHFSKPQIGMADVGAPWRGDMLPTQFSHNLDMTLYDSSISAFDLDKLMEDFCSNQLPGAICQKCGLGGCTCRNCPPLMQDFQLGNWGQGCAKHHK